MKVFLRSQRGTTSSILVSTVVMLIAVTAGNSTAQTKGTATIRTESTSILTYAYSEPDPTPILIRDRRLFPYNAFDGLTDTPALRDWEVVVLENDFIKVFVLPGVGGKVWGAIEKSSGREFIYRNEVLKFRNIALRGPWTSGGIEFNFGVIGHTPSTAGPVDYRMQNNPDGSVSCFVGAMDLPSRTQWRVEVRLPADKAYFETRATWINPTSIEQPYYNWMTGAAFATDDLVLSIPGDEYLRHSGEALPWPVDDHGRDLSAYNNNQFESHKSYHVVGKFEDFFGGYYTRQEYGFGHWSPYSAMPGQKLWLWSLARDGGIWEDLLTDSDGQYVEFQAGRLFVQYSPGAHDNPITQVGFEPYRTDKWMERWFPVVGIGGITDASGEGAMNVEMTSDGVRVRINSFGSGVATLRVIGAGTIVAEEQLELSPLSIVDRTIALDSSAHNRIDVPELGLHYDSDPAIGLIDREFRQDPELRVEQSSVQRTFSAGRELMKARRYRDADTRFDSVLSNEPWHRGALLAGAELAYRAHRFVDGLSLARRVLQLDTYDPDANFIAGNLYRATGNYLNAKEAFGWSARSMRYRAAATTQLSEIALTESDYERAVLLSRQALDYDRFNARALQSLALASRARGDQAGWTEALNAIDQVDPLSAFTIYERSRFGRAGDAGRTLTRAIRNEFPDQTYLELALYYREHGRLEEAVDLLKLAINDLGSESAQLIRLWLAYLVRDDKNQSNLLVGDALAADRVSAMPYRRETLPVLQWLVETDDRWQWRYLLALNYWALDRDADAARQFQVLAQQPDDPSVYIARAKLLQQLESIDPEADFRRALAVDDSDRRTWLHLEKYLEASGRWTDASMLTSEMISRFSDSFVVRLARARTLIRVDQPEEALDVLHSTHVLPAEGSGGGRDLYSDANILAGIHRIREDDCTGALPYFSGALDWPEQLGQGKPYVPEERLPRMLIAYCSGQLGNVAAAQEEWRRVAEANESGRFVANDILTIAALEKLGRTDEQGRTIEGLRVDSTPVSKWVVARAATRLDDAREIIRQNPATFEGLEFDILNQALQVMGL